MTVTERLEKVTAWYVHNEKEMKQNHFQQYNEFVGLVNELYALATKLDKMHEGDKR